RGSSARFATPARKPCLSKQGVRLSTPPMEQKLRDHNAGEKCGLIMFGRRKLIMLALSAAAQAHAAGNY
ncbi:MAG: hypothetical protein WBS14_10855, partial [Rhodomicrobium sp.]